MISVKILALVSALIVVVALTKKVSSTDQKEMIMSIAEGCRKKNNATEEDIKTVMRKGILTTRSEKCTAACLGEQFGIIKEVGGAFEMDCEKIEKFAKEHEKNQDKLDKGKEICVKCKAPGAPDKCEFAAAVATCMKVEVEKLEKKP